VEGCHTN